MGNNNITLKNQELQKLFSIDKNFENYYFNNENNYRKEFIIIEEQESNSLDCLNCNYLCKSKDQEKHNKKV